LPKIDRRSFFSMALKKPHCTKKYAKRAKMA